MQDVLTPAQLAARWDMRIRTLSNWRYQGKGPAYVRLGPGPRARVVYRMSDVISYEQEHQHATRT